MPFNTGFNRAASDYDKHAQIQRKVSQQLAEFSRIYVPDTGGIFLDIGCGSGLTTQAFQSIQPSGFYVGVDSASAMCSRYTAATGCTAIQACMSSLPINNRRCNVIISSMALHWLSDPERFRLFYDMRRMSVPGGALCIAVPVSGSLAEFFAMLDEAAPQPLRRVEFPQVHNISAALDASGWQIKFLHEEVYSENFIDARAMLRYTKHIGANITGGGGTYPGKLFFARFNECFQQGDTAMRWDIAYIVCY